MGEEVGEEEGEEEGGLQPYVMEAATVCEGGLHARAEDVLAVEAPRAQEDHHRLLHEGHARRVMEAATACNGGCNRMR